MKVLVTVEQHFSRSADGRVWTDGQFPYPFWRRYLAAFDSVEVFARTKDVEVCAPGSVRADGERVSFFAVPDFRGPEQYLAKASQIYHLAAGAAKGAEAIILRVPGEMGSCIWKYARRSGHPFGVEVVADPYDVFAPRAVRHPLRMFFRWHSPRRLRQQCREAAASAYVTENALQQRYPGSPGAFTTSYSSVELPENAFATEGRTFGGRDRFNLMFVGSLERLYKAPDVLISAMALCKQRGLNLKLTLAGSGKCRAELEALSERLGLGGDIVFRGQLTSPEAVRHELDNADLFVLPSRQEGLPRAAIEAMARALPCIGSTVGGFPELLSRHDLVEPDSVKALAEKIEEVVTNPERMNAMSRRNLEKARSYASAVLQTRREGFYCAVRECSARFLNRVGKLCKQCRSNIG